MGCIYGTTVMLGYLRWRSLSAGYPPANCSNSIRGRTEHAEEGVVSTVTLPWKHSLVGWFTGARTTQCVCLASAECVVVYVVRCSSWLRHDRTTKHVTASAAVWMVCVKAFTNRPWRSMETTHDDRCNASWRYDKLDIVTPSGRNEKRDRSIVNGGPTFNDRQTERGQHLEAESATGFWRNDASTVEVTTKVYAISRLTITWHRQ